VANVTVLQPTVYMDNLTAPWSAPRAVSDGILAYPVPGNVPMPWVATDDVAIAVERVVAQQITGWFVLPGPAVTGDEIADTVGTVIARPVRWHTVSPDEFAEMLRPHLGDHAADGVAGVYRALAASPPAPLPDPAPAREVLGWAPRTVEAWATHWWGDRPLRQAV
jgi:nucleoside-diphosphate-sugar epimerase